MILHVDMDAFYASIEQRDRPELVGQPVIVGGTPQGRGVVAAANYIARQYGVHSAMPAATARRLCPKAVFLPCRMDDYAQVSRQIREIFSRYTPLVEPLSLDEAFLDVGGSQELFGTASQIGRKIQQDIQRELQLAASVGVAPVKFVAKIASDLEKPQGFVVVPHDGVQQFLDPLPIGRLWGVGRVAGQVLQGLGIRTIGQLRDLPLEVLTSRLGKSGEHLWELARGIDRRPVVPDHQAKSISHETTFAVDIQDSDVLRAWLLELTEQVGRRLRRHKLRGRTIHIKVRFADFRTITRSQTLPEPTSITHEIWQAAGELLGRSLPARRLGVRLLGVGVSRFENPAQIQRTIFEDQDRQKQIRLDVVADQIHAKFGSTGLSRGSRLPGGQGQRRET